MLPSDALGATPRVLVPWSGSTYDHTTVIVDKWKDAIEVGGVLEFEAGRVYRTKQLNLWKRNLSTDGDKTTAAGIDGNGAMLKWVEGDVPVAGKPLLYVSEANFKGNSGFFIRNLTIDCGNNDVPTVANAGNTNAGLAGPPNVNGFFATGSTDKAADYGLFLYAVEDYVIENVTVLRANTAGIHVRGNNNFRANRILFRQVISRFSEGDGWQFSWDTTPGNDTQAARITNIRLENCGASGNMGNGYTIANTSGIQLVNCEAEVNQQWNIFIHDTVSDIDIFGGYSERSEDDPKTSAVEGNNIKGIGIEWETVAGARVAVENLRIIGGRHVGRFRYDYSSGDDDYLIHSYGHTPQGFGTGSLPTSGGTDPLISRYRRSIEQQVLWDQIHPAYYEIPSYYRYYEGMVIGTVTIDDRDEWITELKSQYNIVMVKHIEVVDPMNPDEQTDVLDQAIDDARNLTDTGIGPCEILAFEPGKVYRIDGAVLDGQVSGNDRGAIIGIDGNHATLVPTANASGEVFVHLQANYVSPDLENDYYTFWMRDLNIDANLQFDTAFRMKACKWFHVRNIDITGGKVNGLHVWGGTPGGGTYYGSLTDVCSHHNGDNGDNDEADGIYIQVEPQAEILDPDPPGDPFISIGYVYVNNVGFYRCRSQSNKGNGLDLYKASSILFDECMISGNLDYEVRAGMSYSLDLFNCTINSGQYGTGIKDIYLYFPSDSVTMSSLTLSGYMFGFQIFGGIFRDGRNVTAVPGGIDADQTASGAGAAHTVVHTEHHSGMSASRRTFRLAGMAPDNGTATTEGDDGP